MIIKEAILNNFGRFQNQRISFQEGINVVYGANESGRTTLHTFLRGIFFGLPRKRGLASKTDTYTSFRPWENPAWYEGALVFQCGGKSFRLERDFSKPGFTGFLVLPDRRGAAFCGGWRLGDASGESYRICL